jgi:hypothetical protein
MYYHRALYWEKSMGASKKGGQRDELKLIIDKELPPKQRIALVAELAKGITVQEKGKDGQEKIYTKAPDLGALRFLEEYATGKPVQVSEVQAESGFACILIPNQGS